MIVSSLGAGCVELDDGSSVIWAAGSNKVVRGDEGNSASPSPCTDGKHVWAMTGTGELGCYTLDGKETEFAPPVPPNAPKDAPAPKGKRIARWMANDKGFIIEDEVVNPTAQGGTETILIARKWMHWPDGTFSIETITERGGNAFNNKRVFVKKQ